MYVRWFRIFQTSRYQGIVKATVSGVLKFQKVRTKLEVVPSLPCWLSQFSWDSQKDRARKTSILVKAFWNLNLRSSNTKETVDFTPPWYKTFLKNPESVTVHTYPFGLGPKIPRLTFARVEKHSRQILSKGRRSSLAKRPITGQLYC